MSDESSYPMTTSSDSNSQSRSQSIPSSDNETQNNRGRMTRSQKSGVLFSVARIDKNLRKGRYADRINTTASIYLASTLEYLVAEIMELAGDFTHQSRRKRITPRDISLAIQNDSELAKLCEKVTIPEGGVQPFIHEVLLQNKNKRSR